MKLSVSETGELIAESVFNPLLLRTTENRDIAVCMRDTGLELTVVGSDKWWRVDVDSGNVIALN